MGLMSDTAGMVQYKCVGSIDGSAISQCLNKFSFHNINADAIESHGWVNVYNHNSFSEAELLNASNYYAFTMRHDKKKIPPSLISNLMSQECDLWLSNNPSCYRVPQKVRMELKERLISSLTTKALPNPAFCDVLWDLDKSIITVFTTNSKMIALVETSLHETFPGVSFIFISPMSRARTLIGGKRLSETLDILDKSARTEDVLLDIKNNTWIGIDFLWWGMYVTSSRSGEYKVQSPGPIAADSKFVAYLNDLFLMIAESEHGQRKSYIMGAQNEFAESRKALVEGKHISEAVIYFEKESLNWSIRLRGNTFDFAPIQCPPITVENNTQEEREGAFLERINLLESGQQLFDSFFLSFLTERLSDKWTSVNKTICDWVMASE